MDQLFQNRRELVDSRFRLGNFLHAESVFQTIERRLRSRLLGVRFGEPFDQIKRVEFHQQITEPDFLAFFNVHGFYAAADARADPDFVGLDEARNFQRHFPVLTHPQRGN